MLRRDLLLGAGGLACCGAASPPSPVAAAGAFSLVADWTFGNARSSATVANMEALQRAFRFRYIYDQGRLDGLPTYWSRHRNYPENDPRSLHVFESDALVLKGRIPPGGGLRPGGIESGMLRALLPVTPGMYVEMRAKLPRGLGVWPAFWLNPGVENPDGTFSATPWPPEIDIFEFFVWQGRTSPRAMTMHVQTAGSPDRYGSPRDIFTLAGRNGYEPGVDFAEDYHVFALDWVADRPIWVVDGRPVQQTVYEWRAPPAHILITNQIGMVLDGVKLDGMTANERDWDYRVDYLRVWRRT